MAAKAALLVMIKDDTMKDAVFIMFLRFLRVIYAENVNNYVNLNQVFFSCLLAEKPVIP